MPAVPKNAKTPADRQPKAIEVETPLSPEETPGWDLMKDMADIPVWDQTPLLAMLQEAFDDGEEAENGNKSFSVNIVGDLAKALIPHAKDVDAYTAFVSGPGALERAMGLAMAWVGQMGEFVSSEA